MELLFSRLQQWMNPIVKQPARSPIEELFHSANTTYESHHGAWDPTYHYVKRRILELINGPECLQMPNLNTLKMYESVLITIVAWVSLFPGHIHLGSYSGYFVGLLHQRWVRHKVSHHILKEFISSVTTKFFEDEHAFNTVVQNPQMLTFFWERCHDDLSGDAWNAAKQHIFLICRKCVSVSGVLVIAPEGQRRFQRPSQFIRKLDVAVNHRETGNKWNLRDYLKEKGICDLIRLYMYDP